MIKEILYKWFGIEPVGCQSCEMLRNLLEKSEYERKELLDRLLNKEVPIQKTEMELKPQPIRPNFTPWRVRQQILEAEDREKARVLREKQKEMQETRVSDLEKELLDTKEKSNA